MRRLFIETSVFTKKLEERGGADLLAVIQIAILENPAAGDIVQGCGGVRKMRVADPTRKKGKRGGLRTLYLDLPEREKTYLLYVYGKDESENISADEKKAILSLVKVLKGGS